MIGTGWETGSWGGKEKDRPLRRKVAGSRLLIALVQEKGGNVYTTLNRSREGIYLTEWLGGLLPISNFWCSFLMHIFNILEKLPLLSKENFRMEKQGQDTQPDGWGSNNKNSSSSSNILLL